MIHRYIFVKLLPALASDPGRAEVAEHVRFEIAALPGVAEVVVGIPADEHSEAAWDLSILVRFDSIADVEPYRAHPAHRALVDAYLAPRMQVIKAWNFVVS
jgi:hypothetical protein